MDSLPKKKYKLPMTIWNVFNLIDNERNENPSNDKIIYHSSNWQRFKKENLKKENAQIVKN